MKKLSLILLFFLSVISFAQGSSHITWEKLYQPASEAFHAIYIFDGDSAIAAGADGYVWKTTDGGASWFSIQVQNAFSDFRDIYFYNNKGWVAGDDGIFYSTDYGYNWTQQSLPTGGGGSDQINSIFFRTSTYGWACGSDGSIYRTYDGGSNWVAKNDPSVSGRLNGIYFVTDDKGYVVGNGGLYGYTTDRGENWTFTGGGESLANLTDICFYDENYGIKIGDHILQRTTDGGANWGAMVYGVASTKYYHHVDRDGATFYISGNEGVVLKSTDKGEHWTEETVGDTNNYFYAVDVKGSDVFLGGYGGRMYHKVGTGNWTTPFKYTPVIDLNDVCYVHDSTAFACGNYGLLLKTTNNGKDWTQVSINTKHHLNAIDFPSANVGYVVGDEIILYTSDGGNTWVDRTPRDADTYTSVDFFTENIGYASEAILGGGSGRMTRTTARWNNWYRVNRQVAMYDIEVLTATKAIAVGDLFNVYVTTDRGKTWYYKNTGISHGQVERLTAVSFVDRNKGYACSNEGKIIKTIDGGATWSNISDPMFAGMEFIDIYFADANHGWVISNDGQIGFTEDGGTMWDWDVLPTSQQISSFSFGENGNVLAVGQGGLVIHGKQDQNNSIGIMPAVVITPFDNEIDVMFQPTLEWDRGPFGTSNYSYKFYFGTDGGGTQTPTNIENGTVFANNHNYYEVTSDLDTNTSYYWQVVPFDPNTSDEAVNCPIWSFKTRKSNNSGGGSSYAPGFFFANSMAGSNAAIPPPTFSWFDIHNDPAMRTISSWTGNYDDGYASVYMDGMKFPYFGVDYTFVNISTNGIISFGSNTSGYNGNAENIALLDTTAPNNYLAVLAMNLSLIQSNPDSYVEYLTGADKFIVTWHKMYPKNGAESDTITFQAVLYKNGNFLFQYNNAQSKTPLPSLISNKALIGSEDTTGTMGLIYRANGKGGNIFAALPPKGGNAPKSNSSVAVKFGSDSTNSATPVELISFTGKQFNNAIRLDWTTATEVNNYGFEIQRSSSQGTSPVRTWNTIGFVEGAGNSNSPKLYSFTDDNINTGKYDYRLKQIDLDGSVKFSKIVEVNIGFPDKYELKQNYPNPFNPTTTISYTIPQSGAQHIVSLRVYNILGEKVATLVNKQQAPGNYNVKFNASNLPSGIYFYTLNIGKFSKTRKMILMK